MMAATQDRGPFSTRMTCACDLGPNGPSADADGCGVRCGGDGLVAPTAQLAQVQVTYILSKLTTGWSLTAFQPTWVTS
jgi:hypothetical protein